MGRGSQKMSLSAAPRALRTRGPAAGRAAPSGSADPAGSSDRPAETSDARRSPLIWALRVLSWLLPGEYLKTTFYLTCIDLPRRALREALYAFYRFDHVYAVLKEFRRGFAGRASILEFGTSDGYAFAKLLYATRYLGLEERIEVHTFDSFEGMPPAADERDREWTTGDDWLVGQFKGRYEELCEYCRKRGYRNARIHRGYFEQSIDAAFLAALTEHPPVLVWVDCDYYSSTRTVMERLIDSLPNGCVVYFDEFDNLNFGSQLTGEARIVHEINSGAFGEGIELVPDTRLALQSRRIYRFFRVPPNRMLALRPHENADGWVRLRRDGSPLP